METNSTSSTSYFISILVLFFIIIGILYYLFIYKKPTPSQTVEIRQKTKVENFKSKIQILENKINNFIEYEPYEINVDKERELFELYYKGMPDTYDFRGKLIRGVEPNANKAIGYLNIIINSPYKTEKDVLNLAKIYHYGMHLFERDLDKAEEVYNSLKFENISQETKIIIKESLDDIKKIRVYTWLNLPLERPTINDAVDRIRVEIPDQNDQHDQNDQNIQNVRVEIIQPIVNLPGYPRRQNINNIIDQKDYNDPQNTHNPQVLSTIRHSLEKLKSNTPITKNQGITAVEIREYINNLEESDKKHDALKSLKAIENNLNPLSNTGMKEIDALMLVWNRINDQNRFDKEISNNLKETLFDELASMQEFGVTICETGRFTHIIDTLNGVDEEVSIKPLYAVNEEMMSKSAKIREELLQKETEPERNLLERGTSIVQEEFDNKLKKTIMEQLKEDYVKTGILTETKFMSEVNKWIDHI